MSAILIASITELCASDHRNDPALLAGWLANKAPDSVAQWFDNPASTLLVAERDGAMAAVGGCLHDQRQISLNYVSPDHRFAGVSKALLAALEAELGPGEAMLDSTQTARRFYETAGWEIIRPQTTHRGISGYPMRKRLA